MNRNRFLLTSAAGTAIFTLPWVPGLPVFAQEGVAAELGMKIADKIGDHLLDTVLSKGADAVGLGGVMSFLGMGDSGADNADVLAKLDAINEQLAQISAAVAALQSQVEKDFAQTDYDVAIGGAIQGLIDKNESLNDDFATLLTTRGDTSGLRADIASKMSGDFLDCLAAWNNALSGAHGSTSLIAGWSKVVAASGPFYNRDMAARVQQQWAYFDAQQALSVAYLIEHYNATGQKARVRPTLDAWMRNRKHQLSLLRGTWDATDTFPAIGASGKKIVETTALRMLPKNTVVDRKNLRMWYLPVGPAIAQGTSTVDSDCPESTGLVPHTSYTDAAADNFYDWEVDHKRIVERDTGIAMWQLPGDTDFVSMIRSAGGVAGTQSDHFAGAMESVGFTFPPGTDVTHVGIWAFASAGGRDTLFQDCTTSHRHQHTIYGHAEFNEGGPFTARAEDADTTGMMIYSRTLDQGEAYFY